MGGPTKALLLHAAAAALGLLAQAAWAQPHERAFDRYVVRASVINSRSLPERAAAAAGIDRDADVAILNVTVLKKGSGGTATVPADVKAEAVSLAGLRRDIGLRETRSGQWVSYSGTFDVLPREVLDFTVRARPPDGGQTMELKFRERIWPDRETAR